MGGVPVESEPAHGGDASGQDLGIALDPGVQALGVLIRDLPPIGSLWLDLRPGLVVFYGVNGVGETTVLSAIEAALTGGAPATGRVELHCTVRESVAGDLAREMTTRVRSLARRLRREYDAELHRREGVSSNDVLRWLEQGDRYRWTSDVSAISFAEEIVKLGSEYPVQHHSPRVVLVAAGTSEEAGWHVGVSASPRQVDLATSTALADDDISSLPAAAPVSFAEHLVGVDDDDDGNDLVEAFVSEGWRDWSCVVADDTPDPDVATIAALDPLSRPRSAAQPRRGRRRRRVCAERRAPFCRTRAERTDNAVGRRSDRRAAQPRAEAEPPELVANQRTRSLGRH